MSVKSWSAFVITALSFSTAWSQTNYFNEIFGANGEVRPYYREVYQAWNGMSEKQKEKYLVDSRKAFLGDNALDPMARVIPGDEYDKVLKAGVEQRGLAIRMFLQDHYSRQKLYAQKNVIPEAVIERLLERNQESAYAGQIPPEIISFMYGPDIIRDASGQWRVIEDNPGFIGGVGDLKLAQDYLAKELPSIPNSFRYRQATGFYDELTTRFKQRAALHGGKAVMYMTPPYADREDERIRKLMKDRGIDVVTTHSNLQLISRDGQIYTYDKTQSQRRYEKVGFVFLNGEHSWLDSAYPANYEKVVLGEAQTHLESEDLDPDVRKKLTKALAKKPVDLAQVRSILDGSNFQNDIPAALRKSAQARGLTEAILSGQVDSNYTPGVDFIGDKEFYLYVEELIRLYLHQEPILKNIPTRRFSEGNSKRLDGKLYDEVFANLSKYVVKKVDGRGGDAVWVGPKIKPEDIPAIQDRIRKNPAEYIVQEFTPLSRLNNNIVDLRVIADVAPQGVFVTDTPWGRGLPANGNGKVNLSDQGREITVLIHDGSWGMCKNTYLRH